MTLQNAPPGLDYERDRKFSRVYSLVSVNTLHPGQIFYFFLLIIISILPLFQSFKQMIASCLVKDPSKRPSAKKLLKHSFFKQARSSDYIARKLLDGLPDLVNRVQAIKVEYVELSRHPLVVQYYQSSSYEITDGYMLRKRKKICLHKRKWQMERRRNSPRFVFPVQNCWLSLFMFES